MLLLSARAERPAGPAAWPTPASPAWSPAARRPARGRRLRRRRQRRRRPRPRSPTSSPRGRRTIGTVAGPADMAPGRRPPHGVGEGAGRGRAARRPRRWWPRPTSPATAAPAATAALLARRPDLDGLFAASDLMALGALDALRAAGRRVPERRGGGRLRRQRAGPRRRPAPHHRPPADRGSSAREMARLLLAQLDGGAAGRGRAPVVLRTELVVRASG